MTPRTAFFYGLVTGIVPLLLSYLLRLMIGGVFIPELMAQTIFSLTPGALEAFVVGALGKLAKLLIFCLAILASLLLYGGLGVVLFQVTKRQEGGRLLPNSIQSGLIIYALVLLIVSILLRLTTIFTTPLSLPLLFLTLAPPNFAFGLLFSYLMTESPLVLSSLRTDTPYPLDLVRISRRRLISLGISGMFVLLFSIYGLNRIFTRSKMPVIERNLITQSEITPHDLFFEVDLNVATPSIDINAWRLNVTGLVENSLELTYDELKAMSAVEHYSTLECVGNRLGLDAISTALWKGIPLRDILEQAQVKPEATFIVFRCHDGYDVGIPLGRGFHPRTILAYEMNGEPLPEGHGSPLRASVPGIYGMMHAKWITEIELVDQEFLGFWQRKHWSNSAEYQTHSSIVTPGKSPIRVRFQGIGRGDSKIRAGLPALIAGMAFAGERGISKVEVSVDGGVTWQPVSLKEPLSDDAWVLWFLDWTPPTTGTYQITVRARDKKGTLQVEERQGVFPKGATGYHTIAIEAIDS